MKLLVAVDAHIYRTPDGRHWCKSIYGYEFWKRYLIVFDDVRVVARMKDVKETEENWLLMDGEHVEVYGIPFFQGPVQLAKKFCSIQRALHDVDMGCDAALMRMPSPTASMVWRHLRRGIPLAGEVVFDFTDSLTHSNQNFIIRLLNRIQSKDLSRFCLTANGVSYVTEKAIQEHYPSYARLHGTSREHFESSYSTIMLRDEAYTAPRNYTDLKKLTLVLSSVSMNSEKKGERILISAVKKARDRGYQADAVIIGDGSLRHAFEEYARMLGVKDYITFTGLLYTSDEVRSAMLKADIYVLPTLGEGLPRGILEAMAIGLPVLSTPVGGIPEVIEERYLFSPTDADAFADEICRLMDNPDELTEMSEKNFRKSLEFRDEILQQRRNVFYEQLKTLCNYM